MVGILEADCYPEKVTSCFTKEITQAACRLGEWTHLMQVLVSMESPWRRNHKHIIMLT